MKTRTYISLILNIAVFTMVVLATVFMLVGYTFMGSNVALASVRWEVFKYFTVDSNLLMGVAALIFAIEEVLLLTGKIKEIPFWAYVLKLVATAAVMLTMVVTMGFLAPFLVENYWSLFLNSNLFFHLIIPAVSLLTYCFVETTDKMKFKQSLYGLVPMALYAVFYGIVVFTHTQNGKVEIRYDWYGFAQAGGVASLALVVPIMVALTTLICYVLWIVNKSMGKVYKQ